MLERAKTAFLPSDVNKFEPRALSQRLLLAYAVCLILIKLAAVAFVFYFPQTNLFSAINSEALVSLINEQRVAQKLAPLAVNPKLNEAANLKAQDMLEKGYFDHVSPSGVSPWHWFSEAGYTFVRAGENLAMHLTDTKGVFDAWMASPSHRANMMSPYFKDIGVAVAVGTMDGDPATVSVLEFGTPKTSTGQAPASQETAKTPEKVGQSSPKATEVQPSKAAEEKNNSAGEEKKSSVSPPASAPLSEAEKLFVTRRAPAEDQGKVLGTMMINLASESKNIYLYFSLFLIIALAVNILVKIKIQHVPTIVLTLILAGISISMIFV